MIMAGSWPSPRRVGGSPLPRGVLADGLRHARSGQRLHAVTSPDQVLSAWLLIESAASAGTASNLLGAGQLFFLEFVFLVGAVVAGTSLAPET